jgi:putative acetyltransferase
MDPDNPALLRPYASADEPATIELWQRSWQAAYPKIDFAQRLAWWTTRWRHELVPSAQIVVAMRRDAMLGFITVDRTCYIDQIVVAPEAWGSGIGDMLLAEARRLSPESLQLRVNADNIRATRFYARHGFVQVAQDINPRSGRPANVMQWRKLY